MNDAEDRITILNDETLKSLIRVVELYNTPSLDFHIHASTTLQAERVLKLLQTAKVYIPILVQRVRGLDDMNIDLMGESPESPGVTKTEMNNIQEYLSIVSNYLENIKRRGSVDRAFNALTDCREFMDTILKRTGKGGSND